MGSKIDKIIKLFDEVEHLENWEVTSWTKRIGPPVVHIIDRVFKLPNYLDNHWPIPFGPISDPLVFEVFYLVK
jgi:hypothetical protein